MSTAELIKVVKRLPARERRKLIDSVLAMDEPKKRPKKTKPSRRVKWPDIIERQKKIFGDRVFPNLVLLEREERDL